MHQENAHVHIQAHSRTYEYIHVNIYLYICIYIYTHIYIYIYIYIYLNIYLHVCIHVWVCVHVCVHVRFAGASNIPIASPNFVIPIVSISIFVTYRVDPRLWHVNQLLIFGDV